MDNHLGYTKHDPKGHSSGNSRNGKNKKDFVIDSESVELESPRDRNSSFEPQLISNADNRRWHSHLKNHSWLIRELKDSLLFHIFKNLISSDK